PRDSGCECRAAAERDSTPDTALRKRHSFSKQPKGPRREGEGLIPAPEDLDTRVRTFPQLPEKFIRAEPPGECQALLNIRRKIERAVLMEPGEEFRAFNGLREKLREVDFKGQQRD